jgi:uncharacterized protein (DUF433 family)
MKSAHVISDPDILGGTPVFIGTRVPVRIIFEHLEAGDSLEVFLEDFPSVSRELAIQVLEDAKMALVLAHSNRMEDLAAVVPVILSALAELPPRTLRKVAA